MRKPAQWSLKCVDAGSEYCPCYLAENGHCFVCSLLAGAESCDCRWSGSCSYLNYWFGSGAIANRSERTVIVEKQRLGSNLLKIRFALEAEWLPSYSQAGTFLFIRPAFAPSSAAVPISVVDVSGNEVCLVVKCVGPKTSLLLAADDRVVIRGPYFSGLTDTQILKTTRNEEAVLVAGGMGQSAIVMAAKALLRGGNTIKVCLAPGSANLVYVGEKLRSYGAEVEEVASMRPFGLRVIAGWLTQLKPAVVVCAGPEVLQAAVSALAPSSRTEFVRSQNITMCCGDGLCGSCLSVHFGQERIPLCKAQYRLSKGGN